eukprot:jgi/Bigna1/130276/aug1.11_g4984
MVPSDFCDGELKSFFKHSSGNHKPKIRKGCKFSHKMACVGPLGKFALEFVAPPTPQRQVALDIMDHTQSALRWSHTRSVVRIALQEFRDRIKLDKERVDVSIPTHRDDHPTGVRELPGHRWRLVRPAARVRDHLKHHVTHNNRFTDQQFQGATFEETGELEFKGRRHRTRHSELRRNENGGKTCNSIVFVKWGVDELPVMRSTAGAIKSFHKVTIQGSSSECFVCVRTLKELEHKGVFGCAKKVDLNRSPTVAQSLGEVVEISQLDHRAAPVFLPVPEELHRRRGNNDVSVSREGPVHWMLPCFSWCSHHTWCKRFLNFAPRCD